MGQYSNCALQAGNQLGMASYYMSIHQTAAAKGALGEAASSLSQLTPLVIVHFDPNNLNSEQDVVNVRQQIGGQLDTSNKTLHAAYQLGLHMGLAIGQSGAPQPAWSVAAGLCRQGIQQAEQDLRDPTLRFLDTQSFTTKLSSIAAEIPPQQRSTEPFEDLTAVFGELAASIKSAGAP